MTIQQRIVTELDDLRRSLNSIRANAELGTAFFWQEVQAHATKQCKAAWDKLLLSTGTSDDVLRALGAGDHTVTKTGRFALTVRVSEPVKRLDTELLARALSRKFKVDVATVEAIIEASRAAGTPSLTKRVLEL